MRLCGGQFGWARFDKKIYITIDFFFLATIDTPYIIISLLFKRCWLYDGFNDMIQIIVVKEEELMRRGRENEGEKERLTASYANSLSKIPEHLLSIIPVHTGIGNRLTIS